MSQQVTFEAAATLVKSSLNILDVVGRHVSLRRAGRNYIGLCPFHAEKTPSFNVNPERQIYKCFGCGEGGDSIAFLMKVEGKTYGELISTLADEQGLDILRGDGSRGPGKDSLDRMRDLHADAQRFYAQSLQSAPDVLAYLANRNLTPAWQTHFGIGYAPAGWDNLTKVLAANNTDVPSFTNVLEEAGLANRREGSAGVYDRFRNRLMIPIHDDRGRVVAFGGRALAPDDNPKYLNSPESPIYNKSRILYGMHLAKATIRESKAAILMEGYFDVIAAHMAGLTQAVGVCGTALTGDQVKLLERAGAETLYLCFDSDAAGETAAIRAIELMQTQLVDRGLSVQVVRLEGAKDPDEFLTKFGKDGFMEALAVAPDFLTYKLDRALDGVDFRSASGRLGAVHAVVPILLGIAQPVLRQEFMRQVAERLQLPEETLALEVKREEQRNPTYENKKNVWPGAISDHAPRYKGKKKNGWVDKAPRRIPEDIGAFRQRLTPRLTVDDKEHLLVSHLFLSDSSTNIVMDVLAQLTLSAPPALDLIAAVQALPGYWDSVNDLVDRLQADCHTTGNTARQAYLADRLMEAETLTAQAATNGRDADLADPTVLKRVLATLAERIRVLQDKAASQALFEESRRHERADKEDDAAEAQKRLREEISARMLLKKGNPQSSSPSPGFDVPLEQPQGV